MQMNGGAPNDASSKPYGVYINSMLTQKVSLKITEIGRNMKENLERIVVFRNEGKCIPEGFVRPNSVKILQYSSGSINGDYIDFQVVFTCYLCHPVEGMLIECTAKTITKAGIHAEVVTDGNVIPVTVFIARDHHYTNEYFNSITENAEILVEVIGVRFELNDPYICVIAKLLNKNDFNINGKRKGGNPIGSYDIIGGIEKLTLGEKAELNNIEEL